MATEDDILEDLIVIIVVISVLMLLNRYLGWVPTILTIIISLATLVYASPSVKATILPEPIVINDEKQGGFSCITKFYIKNLSRFPVEVFVNPNLQINGAPITGLGPDYSGKRPWHLFPYEGIRGNFSFEYPPEHEDNKRQEIKMAVEVWNVNPLFNCFIKYPTRHFEFDFGKNKWHNPDFGIDY